ncbi:MAG: DUF2283 domain-containing protein [Magnetococcales bacterium]|nr:DUF2283 domain-containing protein [Magnetococcales bacterium]
MSAYDPRYNVASIRFREKTVEVDTLHIHDELNIDLSPDGQLYGIELLNANEQLLQPDCGKLTVTNTLTGIAQELLIAAAG